MWDDLSTIWRKNRGDRDTFHKSEKNEKNLQKGVDKRDWICYTTEALERAGTAVKWAEREEEKIEKSSKKFQKTSWQTENDVL